MDGLLKSPLLRGRNAALRARGRLYRPSVAIERGGALQFVGSGYGGWHIEPAAYLRGSTIVSAGLGQDASFDCEMAQLFGAKVLVVDPTPAAIEHFGQLRIGEPALRSYAPDGLQPVEAYDLSGVSAAQLELVPKALWIDHGPVRFNKPPAGYVSHSITFDDAHGFIEVPAVTVQELLTDEVSLLKMDIEGAEVAVLGTIADWPVLPRQILIEFDVLRAANGTAKRDVERIDGLLRDHRYRCRHREGRNYLYVLG